MLLQISKYYIVLDKMASLPKFVRTHYSRFMNKSITRWMILRYNYSNEVKDHFENPRNVGSLNKDDLSVGTAIVGKAACGDVIKLQIKVEDGIITDAKFKTFGCGSAIASSSYATEIIKGKTCKEALSIKNTEIAAHLSLPPIKLHCSLLAEDAVKHAILDYQRKNGSVTTDNN